MDDQTEVPAKASAARQGNETSKQSTADKTYVERLRFLALMHLLRWDVSDASIVAMPLGEERIRIGTVPVSVLAQLNRLLGQHHAKVTATESFAEEERCQK